jgi:hypothetical protein
VDLENLSGSKRLLLSDVSAEDFYMEAEGLSNEGRRSVDRLRES